MSNPKGAAHPSYRLTESGRQTLAQTMREKNEARDIHPQKIGFEHGPAKCGYNALHRWMRANYAKAGRCEWCGQRKKTTWALADHGRLTRNPADWLELCYRCHALYDGNWKESLPKALKAELARRQELIHRAHGMQFVKPSA